MSKEKFITLKSTAVPLPIENIDTDQIIPARFLKATTREGFGENLFRDWRYDGEGKPKGTGLGTRIVKSMATSLNSAIVYGDGTDGTRLTMDLPLQPTTH